MAIVTIEDQVAYDLDDEKCYLTRAFAANDPEMREVVKAVIRSYERLRHRDVIEDEVILLEGRIDRLRTYAARLEGIIGLLPEGSGDTNPQRLARAFRETILHEGDLG